jgi:hypothetical protein
MIGKKQMIGEIVKLLENDDIEILQVSIENENYNICNYKGYIETALTGFKSIEIKLLNKKKHKEFVDKLQP